MPLKLSPYSQVGLDAKVVTLGVGAVLQIRRYRAAVFSLFSLAQLQYFWRQVGTSLFLSLEASTRKKVSSWL